MKHASAADETLRAMEAAAARSATADFKLRLYVVGDTRQSNRAIVNVRRICDKHLAGRHHLEILNLRDHPELAASDQIVAAPTLVKICPLPLRRFIGDLSDTPKILARLGLPPAAPA